jgi:hypothetical protein
VVGSESATLSGATFVSVGTIAPSGDGLGRTGDKAAAPTVAGHAERLVAALPNIAGGLGLSLLCLGLLPAIYNLQQGRTLALSSLYPVILFFLVVFVRRAVDRRARHRLHSLVAGS